MKNGFLMNKGKSDSLLSWGLLKMLALLSQRLAGRGRVPLVIGLKVLMSLEFGLCVVASQAAEQLAAGKAGEEQSHGFQVDGEVQVYLHEEGGKTNKVGQGTYSATFFHTNYSIKVIYDGPNKEILEMGSDGIDSYLLRTFLDLTNMDGSTFIQGYVSPGMFHGDAPELIQPIWLANGMSSSILDVFQETLTNSIKELRHFLINEKYKSAWKTMWVDIDRDDTYRQPLRIGYYQPNFQDVPGKGRIYYKGAYENGYLLVSLEKKSFLDHAGGVPENFEFRTHFLYRDPQHRDDVQTRAQYVFKNTNYIKLPGRPSLSLPKIDAKIQVYDYRVKDYTQGRPIGYELTNRWYLRSDPFFMKQFKAVLRSSGVNPPERARWPVYVVMVLCFVPLIFILRRVKLKS